MAEKQGVRGVLSGIDNELARINKQLAPYDTLVAERDRLLSARAALTGETNPSTRRTRRISQDDVAEHLATHPDSWPADIAKSLGVPVTTVSAHLHRGKNDRFLRGPSGWRLR
jgi:hypothetical protein